MEPRFEKRRAQAEAKLKAFREEMRTKRARFIAGSVTLAVVSIFLFAFISGPRFRPFLAFFGINPIGGNTERGLYTDCSGRHGVNPLCREHRSKTDEEWRRLKDTGGKPIPFQLY